MPAATRGSALCSLREGTGSVPVQGNRWVSTGLGARLRLPTSEWMRVVAETLPE